MSAKFAPAAIRICALDEIDAGDHFGDGMLHLDAGIHLDEVEAAVLVHQELDGAGVVIADCAESLAEYFADLLRGVRE